jgi:hypothetical protein
MENIIEKMFKRCFEDKKWKQAIGVALESRRLDKVKDAIEQSNDQIEENLGYTYDIAQNIIKSKSFRTEVLRILCLSTKREPILEISITTRLPSANSILLCQIAQLLCLRKLSR